MIRRDFIGKSMVLVILQGEKNRWSIWEAQLFVKELEDDAGDGNLQSLPRVRPKLLKLDHATRKAKLDR